MKIFLHGIEELLLTDAHTDTDASETIISLPQLISKQDKFGYIWEKLL